MQNVEYMRTHLLWSFFRVDFPAKHRRHFIDIFSCMSLNCKFLI